MLLEGEELNELAKALMSLDDRTLNVEVRRFTTSPDPDFKAYYGLLFGTDDSALSTVAERIIDINMRFFDEAKHWIQVGDRSHYGIKDTLMKLFDLANRAGYPASKVVMLMTEFDKADQEVARRYVEETKAKIPNDIKSF